jgi:4-hydroxy-tetrahydrodipicolinate synthase
LADSRPWRGVFSVLCTPFEQSGAIDWSSFGREVEFCLEAGAHGLVCSVNASEFWTLTEDERNRVAAEVVAWTAARVPVVVGVTGGSAEIAVDLARRAEDVGADAVMAMPPMGRRLPDSAIFAYYRALSAAVRIPIFVQNHDEPLGTRMAPEFVARLVNKLEQVRFIKEETSPPGHAMSLEMELCGPRLRGVMGGIAGRYLFEEHARGACGTMPACEVTDLHVLIWETLDRGDEDGARALFGRLLPLLNQEALTPGVYKWVLRRRGIIASDYLRSHAGNPLDVYDRAELGRILDGLSDLMISTLPV